MDGLAQVVDPYTRSALRTCKPSKGGPSQSLALHSNNLIVSVTYLGLVHLVTGLHYYTVFWGLLRRQCRWQALVMRGPPVQSALLFAIDEGVPGYSGAAEPQRAARLGEQLGLEPKSSGAVGLTSALLSAKSSGSFISHDSICEPRASQEAAESGNFSLRAAHASSMLDDTHSSAPPSRAPGANAAGRRSEGGEGTALLAGRSGEVGGGKPRPSAASGVPDSTSAAGAWWTQCWAVRLCSGCAR